MSSFRLTVPGNLLLAGEYAVLEEGGLGAAVAVEPRLVVTVFPEREWTVDGRWLGGDEHWQPESNRPPTFAGLVFLKALELLEGRGDERGRHWSHRIPPARIEIDSTPFFDRDGRKLGYGSSAALAAGMTAALARLQNRDDPDSAHQIAVASHRHAQGGAGSGYDVTVSWFGGFGLFVGGDQPRWVPSVPTRLPSMALFAGPQAVKTVSSISLYRQWQGSDPKACRDYFDASNAAVRSMTSAKDGEALRSAWEQAKSLGLDLGREIGSSAELARPSGLEEGGFFKALGAGNETGLAADFENTFASALPEGLVGLRPSEEGIRWE